MSGASSSYGSRSAAPPCRSCSPRSAAATTAAAARTAASRPSRRSLTDRAHAHDHDPDADIAAGGAHTYDTSSASDTTGGPLRTATSTTWRGLRGDQGVDRGLGTPARVALTYPDLAAASRRRHPSLGSYPSGDRSRRRPGAADRYRNYTTTTGGGHTHEIHAHSVQLLELAECSSVTVDTNPDGRGTCTPSRSERP